MNYDYGTQKREHIFFELINLHKTGGNPKECLSALNFDRYTMHSKFKLQFYLQLLFTIIFLQQNNLQFWQEI